jgi:hypothetical protein
MFSFRHSVIDVVRHFLTSIICQELLELDRRALEAYTVEVCGNCSISNHHNDALIPPFHCAGRNG